MTVDDIERRNLDAFGKILAEYLASQIGVVRDIDPLTVEVGGVNRLGYQTLDHYDPQVDDKVFVVRTGFQPPVIMGIFGDYAGGGGGGGDYDPPIPQSDVTGLEDDITSLATGIADIVTDLLGRPELAASNTFTAKQIIDLAADDDGLVVDVTATGGQNWIKFTEAGTLRGSIAELVNFLVVGAQSGLLLTTAAGDVALAPFGVINASSKRITSVGDATSAKDAMNRDSGDARYQGINSELTDLPNITDDWKVLHDFGIAHFAHDQATATLTFQERASQLVQATTGAWNVPLRVAYVDADDHPTFSGKTLKLRLKVWAASNANADPGISIAFDLAPVTYSGAADVLTHTIGSAVSGTTATISDANLGTSDIEAAASASFNCPSDGLYCVTVTPSGTLANNAAVIVGAKLEYRWE